MLEVQNCNKMDSNASPHSYTVYSKSGIQWPKNGICTVYNTKIDADADKPDSYSISASFYNTRTNNGYMGLMFNAKDADNFDFVYFRYVFNSIFVC